MRKQPHPQALLQLCGPSLRDALQLGPFSVRGCQQRGFLGVGTDGSLGPLCLRMFPGLLQIEVREEEREEDPALLDQWNWKLEKKERIKRDIFQRVC